MPPRQVVQHTPEYDRIAALPRRALTLADAAIWADVITEAYRIPGGTMTARPWQAIAIAEVLANGGGCLWLPVGVGKTLASYLTFVAARAERPMLLIPATLREKTWADFAAYEDHWPRTKHPIKIVSREELSTDSKQHLLEDFAPDWIFIDESDEHANFDAATPRRIHRYWESSDVHIVSATGTPSRNSMMAYWHHLVWGLRERAPVPRSRHEALMWAAALDNTIRDPSMRPLPGPLGETRATALDWFARRIRDTPGVVIVDGDSCDQPLVIRTRCALEDPVLDECYRTFAKYQENPGGIQVTDSLSRWALDNRMGGTGTYTVWNPEPPVEWVETRREMARFVRDTIARTSKSTSPIDTEKQVFTRYRGHPVIARWFDVRDTFDDNSRDIIWLTDSVVRTAEAWVRESSEPSLVWVGSPDFGRAVSDLTKLRYYGEEGRAADGTTLIKAPEGDSMIISWFANKKGFNLQAWSRQAVFMPPASAKWLEQMFGRSHRSGQKRPVDVTVFLGSGGTIDAFEKALSEAQHCRNSVTLTQKILRAEIHRAQPKLTHRNKYRWASKTNAEQS